MTSPWTHDTSTYPWLTLNRAPELPSRICVDDDDSDVGRRSRRGFERHDSSSFLHCHIRSQRGRATTSSGAGFCLSSCSAALHTFSADEDLLLDEMPWKSHTRKRVALLIDIITSLTADRRPCRRLTRRHFLGRPGVGARRLDATALDDEDRERELRSDAVLSARRRCKRRH